MQKKELLYEGKAKKVYSTEDPEVYIVSYKDDATAFNGLKKGTIVGKGVVNNEMSNFMFRKLEEQGIPTHYIEELNERETAVKKVTIVPLEVIVRNVAAGSLSKRLGLPEGTALKTPVLEFSYKNDELGDPMVNDYHILAMDLATREELDTIADYELQDQRLDGEVLQGRERGPDRLQAGVRQDFRRYHHPGRRDLPRHLPLLGQRYP